MREGIRGQVAFNPIYLNTYCSYLISDKCILILIEFPLIWCMVGLCRSKLDLIFKGLNEQEAINGKIDLLINRM